MISKAENDDSSSTVLCELPTRLISKADSVCTAVFTVISGDMRGEHFRVEPDTNIIIGSLESCDIRISDRAISRSHARVFWADNKIFIEDLRSTNGVIVKGNRINQAYELCEGDQIGLGASTIIRFTMSSALDLEYRETLVDQVSRDSLTKTYNKSFFETQLQRSFQDAGKHSADLTLIMLDIDHFKQINDRWGHPGGDEILKQISRILLECSGIHNCVCRYGGEEFAVICPNLNLETGRQLAEKIRSKIEHYHFTYDFRSLSVTASIGIASLPKTTFSSIKELVSAADKALYLAKASGRNCCKSYQANC